MPDIQFLSPDKNQVILPLHVEVLVRAVQGTGVINGNALTASDPPDMTVNVAAGRIKLLGDPDDVGAGFGVISEADVTFPRMDTIYRDDEGVVQVVEGTPGEIDDPQETGDWRCYISPSPATDIPSGIILGVIYVSPSCTGIVTEDIWMMAAGVEDCENSLADIDGHIASTANPHGVTADQVGLGSVTNDAQVKASEKAAASGVATLDESSKVVQEPASKAQAGGIASLDESSKVVQEPASKAQANGIASLDSDSKVAQDPANATATPTASKIVMAGEDGKIAEGWLPSSSSFWTTVPGTPTRVSDTQFTITDVGNAGLYDQILKRGVILIWLEGSTFQTAMVVSSSYSSNAVTVNIVGDSLTAGFSSMKYCANHAMVEQFIRPGRLGAGADAFKTWFAPCDVYILAADARVKSAGTTNATVFDINDDGSTKFTTKPSISSGSTSDLNNVADNPSALVAEGSVITADIDSVSTTPPTDAYLYIYYYPVSWRYRS